MYVVYKFLFCTSNYLYTIYKIFVQVIIYLCHLLFKGSIAKLIWPGSLLIRVILILDVVEKNKISTAFCNVNYSGR